MSNKHRRVFEVDCPIVDFFETEIGTELWNALRVHLVEKDESILVVTGNHEVELDTYNLIDEDYVFTEELSKFIVTGYVTIDEINYIFVEKSNS